MKDANFFSCLGIEFPLIQAPMAGVSTPQLAAAVSNAGAIGSLGLGSSTPEKARELIEQTRSLTSKPFNVNFFCHAQPKVDAKLHRRWLSHLAPHFEAQGAEPPRELKEIYPNFPSNPAMLEVVLQTQPAIVSFHFGMPSSQAIAQIQAYGGKVLVCVTHLAEAQIAAEAGVDAIVAQGVEAGGHRGTFDAAQDSELGLFPLLRILSRHIELPIIAAGGIMDGAGIDAAIRLGAVGAQLGTAFLLCPESSTTPAHRASLKGKNAGKTAITSAISGRPARGISGVFQQTIAPTASVPHPDYPFAYDAAMQLHAVAKEKGVFDYLPNWAGQGAVLCRELPAAELTRRLGEELAEARRGV